ncbi:MAG: signal peptidase I [Bacilli bacterium]|nr:signal peptidase I [Bacilli bacterium]
MTKRSIKNIILLFLLVAYIVVYKLFIFNNYMKISEMISVSFLALLLCISIAFLGFRRSKNNYMSQNVSQIVLIYLLITFALMYGLGLFTGFLQNAYSMSAINLINNIVAPILIIVLVEMLRYVVIWANRDKKRYIVLFTIALTIFEIAIGVRKIPFDDYEALFRMSATIIIPAIIKNAVMSYLCYHVGYKIPLMYRLVMDVYIFIVPIVPNYGEYLQSLILVTLPIVIYISAFSLIDERNKKVEHIFTKTNFTLLDIPVAIIILVLACLISGFFPHFMIGIGSESMSPKINKGDAVIIEKYNQKKELKKGQIVAYRRDKRLIVHRIVEVGKKNGKTVYVTKGDVNKSVDSQVVLPKDIKGIVRVRIPLIAYPTVWLSELFYG